MENGTIVSPRVEHSPQQMFSFERRKLVMFYALKDCTLGQMIDANICLRHINRNHDSLDFV
jgi:hypothetical protein